MKAFHVRVHWSKDNDWSGIHVADNPLDALRSALADIADKTQVTLEYLYENAHLTVRKYHGAK